MAAKSPFPAMLQAIGRAGAILGVIGVVILLTALGKGAEQFYQSYLGGWMFWMSLTLGCYGLMLLQSMLQAKWGVPLIRLFEAGAKMMPLMGLAFIPIVVAASTGHLYPWADPKIVAA